MTVVNVIVVSISAICIRCLLSSAQGRCQSSIVLTNKQPSFLLAAWHGMENGPKRENGKKLAEKQAMAHGPKCGKTAPKMAKQRKMTPNPIFAPFLGHFFHISSLTHNPRLHFRISTRPLNPTSDDFPSDSGREK